MPRQPTTYQFDLFSTQDDAKTVQTPQWQAHGDAAVTLAFTSIRRAHVHRHEPVPGDEGIGSD